MNVNEDENEKKMKGSGVKYLVSGRARSRVDTWTRDGLLLVLVLVGSGERSDRLGMIDWYGRSTPY